MSLNVVNDRNYGHVLRTNDVVDSECYEIDALKVLMKVRPAWGRDMIETKIFTNGITNKLVGFFHNGDKSDIVLVRVNGNKTEIYLDRGKEVRSFEILQDAGCAPKLYCIFSNGLCYQYVNGRTLDKEIVRSPAVFRLIAKEMAKMHKITVGEQHEAKSPAVFNIIRKFLHLSFSPEAPSGNSGECSIASLALETKLREEMAMLEETLSVLDSPIVFCHNDLLLNNVLFDDEKNIVHFIDYEYADFNYQAFDIANHFCEFAGVDDVDYTLYPGRDMQIAWLKEYLLYFYGEKKEILKSEVEKLYITVNKFALASHFMWGTWALVQAKYSTIDFNYTAYAKTRLGEYFRRKDEFSSFV